MSWWLVIGAIVLTFLLGGVIVADYLGRRAISRHSTVRTNSDDPA